MKTSQAHFLCAHSDSYLIIITSNNQPVIVKKCSGHFEASMQTFCWLIMQCQ